jgi:hypothetical protein
MADKKKKPPKGGFPSDKFKKAPLKKKSDSNKARVNRMVQEKFRQSKDGSIKIDSNEIKMAQGGASVTKSKRVNVKALQPIKAKPLKAMKSKKMEKVKNDKANTPNAKAKAPKKAVIKKTSAPKSFPAKKKPVKKLGRDSVSQGMARAFKAEAQRQEAAKKKKKK